MLQLTFGRVSAQNNRTPYFKNTPSNFDQQSGFATYLYNHEPFGGLQVPSAVIDNYLGAENYIGKLHYSNIWEYRGDFSKTIGRHSFRTGASLATDGWEQPFFGSENDFSQTQTQDGNLDSNTGDGMASMVLGVPGYSEVDNVYSLLHGGKIIGAYFQDQWRATDKLTINLGPALRPYRQSASREGFQCRATSPEISTSPTEPIFSKILLRHARLPRERPAFPAVRLPADVTIAKNGKIIHDNYDNFQPRIGFAYLLTPKTVLHGGYGRFFDNWAGVTENQSNYTQAWPNIAFVGAPGGFNLFGPPTGLAQDPFNFGNVPANGIPPAPSPFSPLNTNFYTDPQSQKWVFGSMEFWIPARDNSRGGDNRQLRRLTERTNRHRDHRQCAHQPRRKSHLTHIFRQRHIPRACPTRTTTLCKFRRKSGCIPGSLPHLHIHGRRRLRPVATDTFPAARSKTRTIWAWIEARRPMICPRFLPAALYFRCRLAKETRFSANSGFVNYVIGGWQLNGIVIFEQWAAL